MFYHTKTATTMSLSDPQATPVARTAGAAGNESRGDGFVRAAPDLLVS